MLMRLQFVGILTFIFALLFTSTVHAHATEPRLEINIDRIIPGGVIDVRGVGFDYETVVTLSLLGTQSDLPLGEVTTDTDGIFLNIVTLPSDIPEGTYYFRGVSPHHYTMSPPLTVQGTAIVEGEDQEARDWDDVLLAPMPTLAPGVVPGSPPQQELQIEQPIPDQPGNFMTLSLIGLVTLLVLGGVFLFSRRKSS